MVAPRVNKDIIKYKSVKVQVVFCCAIYCKFTNKEIGGLKKGEWREQLLFQSVFMS